MLDTKNRMKTYLTLTLTLILTATAAHGQGTFVLWDESVNGPLSENPNAPTSLAPVQFGVSSISGAKENEPTGPNWLSHEDIFLLTVPDGLYVNSISLTIDRPNVAAWIGDPAFTTQLGGVASAATGELLTQWGIGAIGPGSYGMYIGNHDAQPFVSLAKYRLEFNAVPEPSALALLLVGVTALLGLRRGFH